MTALHITILFPLVAAAGFAGIFAVLVRWHRGDRALAAQAMGRNQLTIYALLLSIPLACVTIACARRGQLQQIGFAWPQSGSLAAAPELAQAVLLGLLGALLLYGIEAQVANALARRAQAQQAQAAEPGRAASFASSLPRFGSYVALAGYVSFAEEVVWRGGLIVALYDTTHFDMFAALAASSVLFGVNHAYHGLRNVVLKTVAGFIWGALFIASHSLLAPIVSHFVFQLLAWFRNQRLRQRVESEAAAVAPMPPSRGAAIEVEQLAKRYGSVDAVKDISFVAQAGAIFTIVGPNGAGKTTTLECIEGLRKPDRGRVRVLGLDPIRERRRLYQRTGIQLQADSLPQRIRVGEAFSFYAGLYQQPAAAHELIARCGLAGREQAYYGSLSGGQQRRVLLGLALLGRPELLILDEPTSGLDPQARFNIWQLLREQRDRGAAIIVSTHAMDEAYEHSDVLCMIDHGRVIAQGAPRDLLSAHRSACADNTGALQHQQEATLEDYYLYMTGREYRDEVQK